MSNPTPAMTEAEHDYLANYRNPHLLLSKAEKIAQALHDLSQPENEVVFPAVRYWLADELCLTLERLGNVTGYSVRRGGYEQPDVSHRFRAGNRQEHAYPKLHSA